jgi:hypothetical protein
MTRPEQALSDASTIMGIGVRTIRESLVARNEGIGDEIGKTSALFRAPRKSQQDWYEAQAFCRWDASVPVVITTSFHDDRLQLREDASALPVPSPPLPAA